MSYAVGWKEAAVAAFWRLRAQDPQAAIAVAAAVASLTDEPRPTTSRPLGGTEFQRMRIWDSPRFVEGSVMQLTGCQ